MISVFVRPDKTQIIRAKFKNNSIRIKDSKEIESYYGCFSNNPDAMQGPIVAGKEYAPSGSVEAIENFFKAIKKIVGTSDEIFLVLPDQLFPYIDVEEVTENTTAESF